MRPQLPDEFKKRKLTLTISPAAHDAADRLRTAAGLSISQLVEAYLLKEADRLDRQEKAAAKGTKEKRKASRQERQQNQIKAAVAEELTSIKENMTSATREAERAVAEAKQTLADIAADEMDAYGRSGEYDGYNINPFTGSIDPPDD